MPLRLTEVARRSNLHVATAQRMLLVLQRHGYVAGSTSGYTVGVTSLANAYAYLLSSPIARVTTPVLSELAEATGLTASLSVRIDLSRILVARVAGASALRYQLPVGERLPLHVGAGRVIAAALTGVELECLYQQVEPIVLASGETVSRPAFERALRQIRSQGYAVSRNERALGAASVAAPVTDGGGAVIAMLQVAGLNEDVHERDIDRYVSELTRAAGSVERQIA